MLAEQGADKLTMDGLAERADLGKGTVFRRFGIAPGYSRPCSTTMSAPSRSRYCSGRRRWARRSALDRLIAYGRARIAFLIEHREIARAALDGSQPVPVGAETPLSRWTSGRCSGSSTSASLTSTCWPYS